MHKVRKITNSLRYITIIIYITIYPHNTIKNLKLYICLHGTFLELKNS